MKTITIIGGGLAGLSMGIALRRRNIPAVIREAGRYPRHRVCGEFICGISDATVEALGIADSLKDAAVNRNAAWFRKERKVFAHTLPVTARGLSRYRLDARLARRFESLGGELVTGDRVRPGKIMAGEEGLVLATGKNSGRSNWLGLKVHLECFPGMDEDLRMHLADGAYAGVSRIEEGRFNLCGLFRRRPEVRGNGYELLLEYLRDAGLSDLAEKARAGRPRPESFAAASGFTFSPRICNLPGLALGDAGGMIPPFTGNGMSLALESAHTALPHLERYACGGADWPETCRNVGNALRRRFRTRLRTAGTFHALLTSGPGQRLCTGGVRMGLLPIRTLFRLMH